MTLMIDLPPQTEARLSAEAERAGVAIDEFALQLLMEKDETSADRIRKLAAEIGGPGYVADLSREAIYAE